MSALAERMMAKFNGLGQTEDVVYRPAQGSPRQITALVDRQAPEGVMNSTVFPLRVTVLNDQFKGIDPAQMDRGTDRLDVAERIGGELSTRAIQRIVDQDSEFATLEVI